MIIQLKIKEIGTEKGMNIMIINLCLKGNIKMEKLLMEKDLDYYFPYDDVPTIIPDFFVGNIECQSCERSEMDTFFENYPSLGNAVNMDSQKRYRTFQEFKEAMLLNELRTY